MKVIKLSGQQVVAQGRRQHVYEHPHDPHLIIKLPIPETTDNRGNLTRKRLLDRFRRATVFRNFLREFQEYLELKARYPEPDAELPLSGILGIVQTDKGIGHVYERVSDPDGSLSAQLKHLIADGKISQQQVRELHEHFDQLMREHVVLCHFNLENILYQKRPDGTGRFVWVDSIGNRQFIPTRRWFRWANNRKLADIRDKCLKAMGAGDTSTAASLGERMA